MVDKSSVYAAIHTLPDLELFLTVPEPADGSIVILGHPNDGAPEDAWWRSDASAESSGYGDKHWYPLGRYDVEPPKTWYELTEEHDAEARLFVVTAMDEIRAPLVVDER